MSGRGEMLKLVKKLEKQGFTVARTGSGHWKVKPPDGGQFVIMAFSPSGSGLGDTYKQLQKIGFVR